MTGRAVSARWAFACFVALGLYAGAWGALIPDIKRQIGASDAELGFALLAAAAGTIPGTLICGRLWRRYGWWLLPVTAIASGVALVGPMFATSPLTLAIALLFTGATSGMLDTAMNAAVSETESIRGTRLMYGAHALFSLGGLAAFPTGVARQLGAQPIHVLSVVGLAYIIIGLGSIRSARQASSIHHSVAAELVPDAPQTRRRFLPGALFALMILCAMSFFIEDASTTWSALHLEQTLFASPALGGAAPGTFALFMFVGRLLGQRIGARFTERAMAVGGSVAAALGLAIFGLAPSPLIALASVALAGAGIALVAPALYGRAGRAAVSRDRAAAIARLTSFGYTGFLVGPPIVGATAEAIGLRGAFLAVAALAALLAIGGYFALRSGGPSTDRETNTLAEGEELLGTARG
ncbi:MAG: MFS transporter [Candidatus Limnocylindrales bacterium]